MQVKICGITNLTDAFVAVEAGADYLGFIFYPPSKRSIEPQVAQLIVSELRDYGECPYLVGVFVNETGERMADMMDMCDLDFAQLSGEKSPSLISKDLSPIFGTTYKALRPATLMEAEMEAERFLPPNYEAEIKRQRGDGGRPSLLIDTFHPTLRGGTGEVGDWAMGAKLAQAIPGLMLAGGLNADNVAEAVRQVQPYAVDVASGVESSPGKKDHDLVRRFVLNAKTAVSED